MAGMAYTCAGAAATALSMPGEQKVWYTILTEEKRI